MANKTSGIKIGDYVQHIENEFPRPLLVVGVFEKNDEKYAKFFDGGFWITSRLRKVEDNV